MAFSCWVVVAGRYCLSKVVDDWISIEGSWCFMIIGRLMVVDYCLLAVVSWRLVVGWLLLAVDRLLLGVR